MIWEIDPTAQHRLVFDLAGGFFEVGTQEAAALLDPDGRVVAWNSRLGHLTQLRAEAMIGTDVRHFWPAWDEVGGGRATVEACWMLEPGAARSVIVTCEPIIGTAGTRAGWVLIVRDRLATATAILTEAFGSDRERFEILSRRLIRAEEDERRRIARELHDEIGQALTAVKLHLLAAGQGLDDPNRVRPRLEEGIGIVNRTLRQIRSIALDLRPSMLDDFGLVAAIRSCLGTQARLGGFATELEVVAADPDFRLEPELETACFRVAQESLTNVVRHAGATRVRVRVERLEAELVLSVSDDGEGFDPTRPQAGASSTEGLGLLGMRERVTLLGGRFEIQTSPGQGTSILARFPAYQEGKTR